MTLLFRRMMNRVRPLTLKAAASTTRVVAPAQDVGTRPALSLPGEFDAVIKVVNGHRELEQARLNGTATHHVATVEYVLEKAWLKEEYLAADRYLARYPTSMPIEKAIRGDDSPAFFEEAVLSTNILSGLEFGHWVRDALVTELHGAHEGKPVVGLARNLWPHEPEFRQRTRLTCNYVSNCRIDRLTILDDRGHNSYWKSRFLELRQRLRESVQSVPGTSAGPLVLLSRGNQARVREPTNQPDIQAALEAMGFQTVIPSQLSVPEIGLALRDARMVVSPEGSHLNHLHFFAPDNLTLISVQDPLRFYAYHKGLLDFYEGLFAFVVGRPDPDFPGRYRINIDDLMRTIDLAG